RSDVVAALRRLQIPVLRWPGGCFADEYHWKDGIGPREKRPAMINTHWGGVVENNHFGTHEFFDLCEQLGTEPYVCGNVGSGSVQEMMEWVEYMTSDADSPMANLRRQNGREQPWKLPYFGVGNESWGCGGHMRPEYYADNYRRYNTFVKNYGTNKIARIACGANSYDTRWTEVLMERAADFMDGLSLHFYTIPTGDFQSKGAAAGFDEAAWHATLWQAFQMDDLVQKHATIMDRYDPKKRVGMVVDEWGTWYDPTPCTNPGFLEQQNTLRDALVAGLTLHIFHKHRDRVTIANIAQAVNVLQAMVLTDKERMILTPTYHVFEMFKVHQDTAFLPLKMITPDYEYNGKSFPAVSASASQNTQNQIHISLLNLHPSESAEVEADFGHHRPQKLSGRILTTESMDAENTFTAPEAIKPTSFTDFQNTDNKLRINLPPKSLVVISYEN
ncbi:MAG: alpha-N-arabinofuranosidase, partial [Chthoniobacterales bacterium]